MTTPEPQHTCGACGGTIGRFRVQRGQAFYNAWLHTGDVTGLLPHGAVLGAPGRRATVEEMTEALGDGNAARELWHAIYARDAKPKRVHIHREEVPPPRVPARPAVAEELPTGARTVQTAALAHGWDVRAIYSLGPVLNDAYQVIREVEVISLRMSRGGQRLVACWERLWSPNGPAMVTKRTKCLGCKKLDCPGCELGVGSTSEEVPATWEHSDSFIVTPTTQLVKLTDLKAQITAPEAYCHSCGQVLGNHAPDPARGFICPIQPEEGAA